MKKLILFIALFFWLSADSFASHIRAGDLTAVRISEVGLTYRFTATIYTDDEGVPPDEEVEFLFGVSPDEQPQLFRRVLQRPVGNSTTMNVYEAEFTFPGPGEYKVSVVIRQRNQGILNIPNSDNTAFCIESTFLITPFLGLNAAPILTIPPVDFLAKVGIKYIHNPGAYDPDGDSLSYSLTICKKAPNKLVDVYYWLDDPRFEGKREDFPDQPAILTLDSITGDLVWDAPFTPGEYNVAFYVDEWRDGVRIGRVNRDIQIIVKPNPNEQPQIIAPDTCVIATSQVFSKIIASDPDSNLIALKAYGELFQPRQQGDTASFDTLGLQPPNGYEEGVFTWNTVCQDVRENPYFVIYKVEDFPIPASNKLTNTATQKITVVAPPPDLQMITVNALEQNATLNWGDYPCTNASHFTIWRRIESAGFEPDTCVTGIPEGLYTQIAQIDDIFSHQFTDDNDGKGLERGKRYCYRMLAHYPNGTESIVSQEICIFLQPLKPYITNVSIEATAQDTGKIFVRWVKPIDLDTLQFPPPYTFRLARATGYAGTENYTAFPQEFAENDTTFLDSLLNTQNLVYNYRVMFFSDGNLVDSSEVASSVRLLAQGTTEAITLNWQAEVPWNNRTPDFPTHYIYREKLDSAGAFYLIDSVDVTQNGFSYTDVGKFNNEPLKLRENYCYYVTTYGAYDTDSIFRPLLNKSQIACANLVLDTIKPLIYLTNVSIQKTAIDEGEILVRWTKALRIDATLFQPPYTYKLLRAKGFAGNQEMDTIPQIFNFLDTTFLDKSLNTSDSVYHYRVLFYYRDTLIAQSETASSVRLTASVAGASVQLNWQAETPWNNRTNYKHLIYRKNTIGNFEFLDSIDVQANTFSYFDDNDGNLLEEKKEYCYYVTTLGTYFMDSIPEPLHNQSQEICVITQDTTSPCPPVLSLESIDCQELANQNPTDCPENEYTNSLRWQVATASECDPEIAGYNLYFKRRENDKFEILVQNLLSLNFMHQNLNSVAGCYAVSALDFEGNESLLSNLVCADNCPIYDVPNIFTPNNDGKNDVFTPLRCPRFVKTALIRIYSRWGQKIFETDNPNINWNGETSNGVKAGNGMYFYDIRLTFERLDSADEEAETIIKGWVELLK